MKKRHWSSEQKLQIVMQGVKDRAVADICDEFQISQGQYYKWRDQFLADAGKVFEMPQQSQKEIAVALVRALGLDAEAKAKAGSNVTVTVNGQTLVLTDNAEIPSALRGYVQFALDKGILQAFYSLEQGPFDFTPTLKARVKPNDSMTRGFMAFSLDNYTRRFVAGN